MNQSQTASLPALKDLPDATGHFGPFGGRYVPETLMSALVDLEREYRVVTQDPTFQAELDDLLHHYAGRPTPLYEARHLSVDLGGRARILLKREDLCHTGAHKINQALAQALPHRAAELEAIIDRLVDLAKPFSTHAYYTAAMHGSYSIKAVLPALVPDLSYDDMSIADGLAASHAYGSLHFDRDEAHVAEVREALLEYCGFDTLAMVRILEVLEGV